MIVLSIIMLGEFLSANVSTPFLLFMVKGFGEFSDEAEAAYMTGVLVSMFFLTQFLTSLLWATVAERYGQRAVMFVSLLGTAATCVIFGTATSFKEAVAIRLMQGVFAGAIGVARGSVTFITDASNEGRAYAILGFCWGFGGVAGAIIGGAFETPAKKWPGIFEKTIFVNYPYLLPTAIASSITLTGAILTCFLGPDGGPRQGAIKLPEKDENRPATIPEEEEDSAPSVILESSPRKSIYGSLRKKVSGYFGKPSQDPGEDVATPPVPMAVPVPRVRSVSRSKADGSAYGYGSAYNRRFSNNFAAASYRRGSVAQSLMRRRGSNAGDLRASFVTETGDLNFAQRLVLANENAVTNIADLWVAAAMNVDNEEVFESDDDEGAAEPGLLGELDEDAIADTPGSATSTPAKDRRASSSVTTTPTRDSRGLGKRPSNLGVGFRRNRFSTVSPRRPSNSAARIASLSAQSPDELPVGTLSARRASNVPSIFAHSGLKTPPAVMEQQYQPFGTPFEDDTPSGPAPASDSLAAIAESRRTSVTMTRPASEVESVSEKAPSLMSMLPIMMIAQYGLLALHSTTHDQVFYSYLVSKYEAGGLNLNPGHFSQLIALMSLAQILFQFYFYPNIGPPRGRFSHLSMFRLGSLLFIPAYLSVTVYRAFASPDSTGNLFVMAGLAISTSIRFCGSTFAYTAVSILLNYMSPPPVVGFANGIAQSIVSLARFLGPIFGGYLWSVSVDGDPNGYSLGFIVVSGVCAAAIAHSFFIR
ncbi:major facilitator MFS-1 [Punctularia strigosozonata HHB-11173 SS5]|uniref:major facilitator MFS-1 n=1 Tax=Punctularia strigosozonata (strain HHB-11173) TaxID=741275 RepID=UPI0004417D92|nr:major facilitator MFS-1 [Punctularia strigosozonata HHB-11173 SS5]EIN08381.1 major facilitator MFS-1 [Punctularia strigosozonata HHB-11173 SS5]